MSRVFPHAISRSANDIAGERVSLFTFGAVGDGVADDTAAVQNAINDFAGLEGGDIYVPGGYVFKTTGAITIPANIPTLSFSGDGYGLPDNWYQRVGTPITPIPSLTSRGGSIIWNTGSGQLFSPNSLAFKDMQLTFRGIGFYGGSGVIKLPNLSTTLNFSVRDCMAMFCTGAAFELGADDTTGNAYVSRFVRCFFYNNATAILNHFACDLYVDDCFFQDHSSHAIDLRAAMTRICNSTFISGNLGTEDILLTPTGNNTATALYNIKIIGNKFGNENSVAGETRVKIRVGNSTIKAAHPTFYVANADIHDNIFVGTIQTVGNPTACIALYNPLQASRIHHNDFLTATYAVDDSNATVSSVAYGNQYHGNQHQFGISPFKSGGVSFHIIEDLEYGVRATAQPSATAYLPTENQLPNSEAFGSWVAFHVTVTTGQSDPLGGTGACLLTRDTTALANISENATTTTTGSIVFSVWLKSNTSSQAQLQIQNSSVVQTQIQIGLDSSWRRYTIRLAGQSASTVLTMLIYPGLPTDTVSESIYAFGAQVNSGDESQGYRKTTGTAIAGTIGIRFPNDVSVGNNESIDGNLAVTGNSVITGNETCTIATFNQGSKAVFSFAYMALLASAAGFGIRLALENDGTARFERTSNGFASLTDTPLQFDVSGNLVAQKDLYLTTLTAHGPVIASAGDLLISLGAGTSGQIVTSNGPGVDPSWQSPTAFSVEHLTAIASGLPQTIPFAIGDVAGATITLDKTGEYLVLAFVTMNGDNTTGKTMVKMNYAGSDQTEVIEALVTSASGTFDGTYSAHWLVSNSGSNVAKLRATKAVNAGTAQIMGARISAIFLG
jgi:hypothetical protein